jgi:hypothetical protein
MGFEARSERIFDRNENADWSRTAQQKSCTSTGRTAEEVIGARWPGKAAAPD